MSQRIELRITPFKSMRYKTLGDYYKLEDGTVVIETADYGKTAFNYLTLIHELCEYMLTQELGIKEEDIKKFDEENPDADDPGMEREAPYRNEHLICDAIERILAAHLNIPMKDYEDSCNKLWDTWEEKVDAPVVQK